MSLIRIASKIVENLKKILKIFNVLKVLNVWKNISLHISEYKQYFYDTHVIARFENSFHIFVHIVMIQRHEKRIDDDAEGDEELYEWIKDQQGHVFLKLEPEPAAVPDAKDVDTTVYSGQ